MSIVKSNVIEVARDTFNNKALYLKFDDGTIAQVSSTNGEVKLKMVEYTTEVGRQTELALPEEYQLINNSAWNKV